MCSQAEIAQKLHRALDRIYHADHVLLELEVHERTIASRLAMYLQDEFTEWNVDCEYNRDARDPKRILGRRVYPDVVVHRRNTTENLLAIEMKGCWSNEDREPDYQKLSRLTGPDFGYELGAHVELEANTFRMRWFEDGRAAGAVR